MNKTPSKLEVRCFYSPSAQDEITPLMDLPLSLSFSLSLSPTNTLTVLFHLVNYEWRAPLFFCLWPAQCPLSALYCTCTHHIYTQLKMGWSEEVSDQIDETLHEFTVIYDQRIEAELI